MALLVVTASVLGGDELQDPSDALGRGHAAVHPVGSTIDSRPLALRPNGEATRSVLGLGHMVEQQHGRAKTGHRARYTAEPPSHIVVAVRIGAVEGHCLTGRVDDRQLAVVIDNDGRDLLLCLVVPRQHRADVVEVSPQHRNRHTEALEPCQHRPDVVFEVDVENVLVSKHQLRTGKHRHPRLARARLAIEGVDPGHVKQCASIITAQDGRHWRLVAVAEHLGEVERVPSSPIDLVLDHGERLCGLRSAQRHRSEYRFGVCVVLVTERSSGL